MVVESEVLHTSVPQYNAVWLFKARKTAQTVKGIPMLITCYIVTNFSNIATNALLL